MKLRFLGLLAVLGLVSAAVLVLVSYGRTGSASNATTGSADTGACILPAATTASVDATDGCCAAEQTMPAVATLSAGGCPYVSDSAQPLAATIDPHKTATADEADCCAVAAVTTSAD